MRARASTTAKGDSAPFIVEHLSVQESVVPRTGVICIPECEHTGMSPQINSHGHRLRGERLIPTHPRRRRYLQVR